MGDGARKANHPSIQGASISDLGAGKPSVWYKGRTFKYQKTAQRGAPPLVEDQRLSYFVFFQGGRVLVEVLIKTGKHVRYDPHRERA